MTKHIAWMGAILMAAGCASAPIHYYTLTPAHSTPADPSGAGIIRIDMSVAKIPAQVNRSELVVRRGNEELIYLENDQWASALGEEIRAAILIALRADLAKPDAATIREFTKIGIGLDIQRFDSVPGRYDSIEATWRLVTAVGADSPPRMIECRFSSSVPISNGSSAIVAGYQRQLGWLANDIEVVLSATLGARPPSCPNTHDPP